MKRYLKYAAMFAATIGLGSVLTSCQDDFDEEPVAGVIEEPVATLQPNISILDFKKACWKDDNNYILGMENVETAPFEPLGTKEDGSHYIIAGRVVSSDEESNVYKSLVIQDETAAIAISINRYNLYQNYRVGQEIVIDVTGMFVGKYNGLLQIGYPSWYTNGNVWNASFMSPQFFEDHIELNGWPDASKIDTLVVNSFSELETGPEGLMKWQSQLVRFNNVEFTDAGKLPFGVYQVSGTNRNLADANGSSVIVRTSGYSTFWSKTLPTGRGDVVAICSYYGTDGWQLYLNDYEGCINFGNPTIAPGTEDNPYTVDEAIADQNKNYSGWVTGYIVGTVMPEHQGDVTKNEDIDWTGENGVYYTNNSLVIGQTADTRDIEHCIIIDLPVGSPLQTLGNLADHAENYGKQIWVRGTLANVMGHAGVTNNNGASGSWRIDGVDGGVSPDTPGTGTEDNPYTVTDIINLNPQQTQATDHPGVWVKGYIVGWADMSTEYYINENTARFNVDNVTMKTNLIVAGAPDVTDLSQCIGIQLPGGNVRTALNLQDNPQLLGQYVLLKGDVMKYSGIPGIKNTSEYKLDGSSTTPDPDPVDPVTSINENFDAGTAIPTGWTNKVVTGDKSWFIGSYSGNSFAAISGYNGKQPPFNAWLITPALNLNAMSSKVLTFDSQVNTYGSTTSDFKVFVLTDADPAKCTPVELKATFAQGPSSGYSDWVNSGNLDLSAYSGIVYIGWQYTATEAENYSTWRIDNVKLNAGSGTVTPDPTPDPDPDPTPSGDYKGDFNSFNNGTTIANPYGTYTNATGWTADYAVILGGTDDTTDANPLFTFIGPKGTLAPTLNGRTDRVGKLTSPVLTGGIGTLTFNYGFAFNESKCQFRVDIKDANGTVVKTDTITLDSIQQKHAYSYSLECNVSGNFTIEITNLCYSGSTDKNKDRVSIWNLTWTNL